MHVVVWYFLQRELESSARTRPNNNISFPSKGESSFRCQKKIIGSKKPTKTTRHKSKKRWQHDNIMHVGEWAWNPSRLTLSFFMLSLSSLTWQSTTWWDRTNGGGIFPPRLKRYRLCIANIYALWVGKVGAALGGETIRGMAIRKREIQILSRSHSLTWWSPDCAMSAGKQSSSSLCFALHPSLLTYARTILHPSNDESWPSKMGGRSKKGRSCVNRTSEELDSMSTEKEAASKAKQASKSVRCLPARPPYIHSFVRTYAFDG